MGGVTSNTPEAQQPEKPGGGSAVVIIMEDAFLMLKSADIGQISGQLAALLIFAWL